jgi:hypothetical protein
VKQNIFTRCEKRWENKDVKTRREKRRESNKEIFETCEKEHLKNNI